MLLHTTLTGIGRMEDSISFTNKEQGRHIGGLQFHAEPAQGFGLLHLHPVRQGGSEGYQKASGHQNLD